MTHDTTPATVRQPDGSDARIVVLHVDDDPAFADLTETYLERVSDVISVETVKDGEEALTTLDSGSDAYDCIVSDYEMPDMDGLTLLKRVRDHCREPPFVLFTGKGSEAVASEAIAAGVTEYVPKAGHAERFELLAKRVEDAVSAARTERQRRQQVQAIEAAREGIAILDEDGRFEHVNPAYADI